MRFVRASTAALLAILAAGCGSSDSPSVSAPTTATTGTTVEAPAPVGGVVAAIDTNRLYALNRGFGLLLQNVGTEPVAVREIQLDSPLFATMPLAEEGALLQPGGRRFALRLPYGEARCDSPAEATFGVVVVTDDGEELRMQAAEEHPGAIGRMHERECAAAEVRERADLRFGDEWTRDGDAITGELILEELQAGEPVAVEDARGSVIFTIRFDDDEPPVLRVTDDEPRATVPVTIAAERCDPHTLAESKRTFLFLTWVAVGDAEPVPMDLEPTGAARDALQDVFETCASEAHG